MYTPDDLNRMSPREISNMLYNVCGILERIDGISKNLKSVREKYRPTEGGYKELWHGIKPFWPKAGIVLAVIVILGIMDRIFTSFLQILFFDFGFSENMSKTLIYVLQILLIVSVPVLVQIYANKRIVKHNMKNADRLEANKQFNRQVYAEEMAVREKLAQAKREYFEYEPILPSNYKYNKDALKYMALALYDGRTDSLGGAINLYEEYAHRVYMEEAQDELIRQQQEANRLAEANIAASLAAAEASRRAEWAAVAAANAANAARYR